MLLYIATSSLLIHVQNIIHTFSDRDIERCAIEQHIVVVSTTLIVPSRHQRHLSNKKSAILENNFILQIIMQLLITSVNCNDTNNYLWLLWRED